MRRRMRLAGQTVCVDPARATGDAQPRLVRSEIDPVHDPGDKAGRKPDCAQHISRAPQIVGWIPAGGDLGDDTVDHRAERVISMKTRTTHR